MNEIQNIVSTVIDVIKRLDITATIEKYDCRVSIKDEKSGIQVTYNTPRTTDPNATAVTNISNTTSN